MFLARTLPLTEKSGLNIISQFNTDNKTLYDASPGTEALLPSAPDASSSAEAGDVLLGAKEDAAFDVEEGEMVDQPENEGTRF